MSDYVWNPQFFKDHYESQCMENRIVGSQEQRKLHYLLKRVNGLKNLDVVDLGCGYGRLSKVLLPYAKSIIGSDINEANLDFAHSYVGDSRFTTKHLDLSIGRLPFDDASADLIVMDNVLMFIPTTIQSILMLEINRILKEGGVAYFNFPNSWNPFNYLQDIKYRINSIYHSVPRFHRLGYMSYLRKLKLLDWDFEVYGETFHVKIMGKRKPSKFMQSTLSKMDEKLHDTPLKVFMSGCFVIASKRA